MKSQGRWYKDQFHLYWHDDAKTIMVIQYVKSYNWHGYYGMLEVAADMIADVAYPIVYINEWYEDVDVPTDSPIPHFTNMNRMFSPQAMILIPRTSQQFLLAEMAQGAGFIKGEHLWYADTYDEALNLAQHASERLLGQYTLVADRQVSAS